MSGRGLRPPGRRRWRRGAAGALSAVLAGVVAVPLLASPASAEAQRPGNVAGLMAQAGSAPDAVNLPGGSGQTGPDGDYRYAYPFDVPKGRKGLTPSVGLSYASSGAVHGGVAAGWSLTIPAIGIDPSQGSVRPGQSGPGSASNPQNFVGPDGSPLVKDPDLPVGAGEVGYRAVGDSKFTKFEYLGGVASSPYWWQAYSADGLVTRFGLKTQHPYGYAPIVSQIDADNHELKYTYTTVGRTTAAPTAGQPREFLPNTISYWSPGKSEDAGDKPYALVSFQYADPAFCGAASSGTLPVGSTLGYRMGFGKLSGTRKLTSVNTYVNRPGQSAFDLRSQYTLGYNNTDACTNGKAAPYRELASIQRTVYPPVVPGDDGPVKVLPPVKFTYGKADAYTMAEHYTAPVTLTNSPLKMPESVDTNQFHGWSVDGEGNPKDPKFADSANFETCESVLCPVPRVPGETDPADIPPYDSASWILATGQSTGERVSRMWLDLNNDGRTDLLEQPVVPALSAKTPSTGGCQVDVYMNTAGGFVKNDPNLFGSFSLRNAMADVPVKSTTGESGAGELLCSLTRTLSSDASGGWRGDRSTACSSVPQWGAKASWGSMQQVRHGFVDVDGDHRLDLVSQPSSSVDCPYASTAGIAAPRHEPGDFDDAVEDADWEDEYWDDGLYHSPLSYKGTITKRQKYWYVYRNTGKGFASEPTRVAVSSATPPSTLPQNVGQVPQASIVGAYTASASNSSFQFPAVSDINGDGYLDMLFERGSMTLGRQGGRITDDVSLPGGEQNTLLTPQKGRSDAVPNYDNPDSYTGFLQRGVTVDVNGDGLADRVNRLNSGTQINFNTGYGFASAADGGEVIFNENDTRTKNLDSFRAPDLTDKNWQEYPHNASRYQVTSMTDIDYDGLPDLLFHDIDQGAHKAFMNGGVRAVTEASVDTALVAALGGAVKATGTKAEFADRADYGHRYTHKATDLNGDGLLDLVEDSDGDGNVTVRYAKQVLDTSPDRAAPARLLRTVDNGMGGKTTVSYSRSSSAKKWMVSQVSSSPGHGEPAVATKYSYSKAMYKPGPYGQASFRGAAEVRAQQVGDASSTADDATTITNYSYTEDPRGVPVRQATVLGGLDFQLTGSDEGSDLEPAAAQAGVMSLVKTKYHTRDLNLRIPGSVDDFKHWVAMPEEVTSYTCTGASGQTLQACEDTAPKTVSTTTWSDYNDPSTGKFVMVLPSRSEMQFTNADGQIEIRRSVPEHFVAFGSGVFNVAPKKTTDSVVVDGSESALGETRYSYHDIHFRQVKNVTVDDAKSGIADRVSRFEYYADGVEAGQVKRSWQPEQVARHGNSATAAGYTEVEYDAHGVTVDRTVGPIRYNDSLVTHESRQVVDLATGAVLESQGPNYACADADGSGSLDPAESCTFDAAAAAKLTEFTRNKVDGLGRILSTRVYAIGDTARAEDGGTEIARATYNDDASYNSGHTQPVSSVTESAAGDGDFTRTETKLDGMGRALQQSVRIKDAGLDRVTVYDYDDAGRVRDVIIPRADASGTVTLRTSYDALGRVISNTDISATPHRLFDEHSYDGLSHTVRQAATPDGSPASVVRTTTDAAGQLVKVEERTGGTRTSPTFAATHYRYDGAGRTRLMTDPDGVQTAMSHDYVGNRTSITSSGKTWSYAFDGNSQMTAITEPVPVGKSADAFTHHMAYDDAGRLVKETPAVRDLTADQLALLKIGEKTYTYDKAHSSLSRLSGKANFQVGQLSYTTAKDSTTPTPKVAAEVINRYNADGHLAETSQDLPLLNGLVPDAGGRLQAENTVHAAGIGEAVEYRAFTSGGVETFDGAKISYDYDRDGTPFQASFDLGGKNMTIRHTRNQAGLVTQRQTNTAATTGFGSPKIDYGYDKYGRVKSLTAAVGSTQRYKQTLGYYDNGEIGQITEQLGDTTAPTTTSTYTYDYRRQLTGAAQAVDKAPAAGQITGFVGYNSTFTHTPGGRLATANVTAAQPTKRLTGRNVSYIYNSQNPQQLDELRKNGDGTALSTYTYDDAGNTITRTVNGTTITQTWDGGRLRIAEKQNGEKEVYYYDGAVRIATARYNTAGTLTEVIRTFGDLETVYKPGQNTQHRQQIALGADTIGRIDGNDNSGTFEHYLTSPQGHQVLALTSDTGATTIRTATYGAFGEALTEHTPASTPAGKYRKEFNGKDYDPTSGLHYYGHRYYDPLALQWTSADPLYRYGPDTASPRNANLYTYTNNNPIGQADLNGLCTTGEGCYDAFAALQGSLEGTNEYLKIVAQGPNAQQWGPIDPVALLADTATNTMAALCPQCALTTGAIAGVIGLATGDDQLAIAGAALILDGALGGGITPGPLAKANDGIPLGTPTKSPNSTTNPLREVDMTGVNASPCDAKGCGPAAQAARARISGENPNASSSDYPGWHSKTVDDWDSVYGPSPRFTNYPDAFAHMAKLPEGATGYVGFTVHAGPFSEGHVVSFKIVNGRPRLVDASGPEVSYPGMVPEKQRLDHAQRAGNTRPVFEIFIWPSP